MSAAIKQSSSIVAVPNTSFTIDKTVDYMSLSAHNAYEDDQQYKADVHAIADLKPGFLMIQDWGCSGYGLPMELIRPITQDRSRG